MKKFLFPILLCLANLTAQELSTSLFEHFQLFSKLVEVDAVNSATNKGYNIAILYNAEEDESKENADNLASLLKNEVEKLTKITEIEFHFNLIEYKNKGKLYLACDKYKTNTIYVCQYMEEDDIRIVKSIAEKLKIITFTASEDLFEEGLSATVEKDDDDNPILVINNELISKERTSFNPDLFTTFAKLEK